MGVKKIQTLRGFRRLSLFCLLSSKLNQRFLLTLVFVYVCAYLLCVCVRVCVLSVRKADELRGGGKGPQGPGWLSGEGEHSSA